MKKEILQLFLYNDKLKFNEIEKSLKSRSNKVAYHLKNLIKKKILINDNGFYKLHKENLIPYLSVKKHMLPVVLIHIGNKDMCFLYKRDKRPFKNLLGLPGGRILIKENIEDSVKRIMKEKHRINAKLEKIHSVSIEHITNAHEIIQSDLIIFVTATTKEIIKLKNVGKNKSEIIQSDYKLIKKHLDKKTKIEEFLTLNNL